MKGPIYITANNGGTLGLDTARERPIDTVLSGPASGVVASVRMGEAAGRGQAHHLRTWAEPAPTSPSCERERRRFTTTTFVGDFPLIMPVVNVGRHRRRRRVHPVGRRPGLPQGRPSIGRGRSGARVVPARRYAARRGPTAISPPASSIPTASSAKSHAARPRGGARSARGDRAAAGSSRARGGCRGGAARGEREDGQRGDQAARDGRRRSARLRARRLWRCWPDACGAAGGGGGARGRAWCRPRRAPSARSAPCSPTCGATMSRRHAT